MLDQRWRVDDPALSVDDRGQLVERSEAGLRARLAHARLELAGLTDLRLAHQRDQLVHIEP